MGLGEKLQAVHNKVNTKLGTQDAPITFRKRNIVKASEFGKPYANQGNVDVTIAEGIKIRRIKSYETDVSGTFKIGDLKLFVPASLITESQIKDAEILYSNETYNVLNVTPTEIFSSVAVQWLVIARLKTG